MLSNKIIKKYNDIWGELFRIRKEHTRLYRSIDPYGRRRKNNKVYYRFSFYVGRFGVVRRRKTRYGKAFADKQKLKIFYNNILESHIRFKWAKSLKYRDNALFKFFHYLESRLDVLLYRANYVFNMRQAQELVESGMVMINGKTMWDKAYMVKPYEIVRLKKNCNLLQFFVRLLQERYKLFPLPDYIEVDYKTSTILYTGVDIVPSYPFKVSPEKFRILYH